MRIKRNEQSANITRIRATLAELARLGAIFGFKDERTLGLYKRAIKERMRLEREAGRQA